MPQSDSQSMAIGEIQLPQCSICKLQPIPQSVQFLPFIMLEVFLAFISLKLFSIFLLFSYCFTRNAWFCPQCKRQVEVIHEVPGVSQNLIVRMGNCMFMLSKTKFRVIAAILASYLVYQYATEIHQTQHIKVEKTWESLATNCGYQAFLQNSYRANTVYAEYPQLGEWTISGIFLRQQPVTNHVTKILLKMNPSQFKNADTEDVAVIITSHTLFQDKQLAVGDIVEARGQWQGREAQGHLLKFSAMKVRKTGAKMDPRQVKLLASAERFIKSHMEQNSVGKNLASEKVKTIIMNN